MLISGQSVHDRWQVKHKGGLCGAHKEQPSSFLAGEYQMAQLLHHQDSGFYDKELHGCRWGILQFFGFRRRQRSAKMQPDKKHGPEKNSRGKLSGP